MPEKNRHCQEDGDFSSDKFRFAKFMQSKTYLGLVGVGWLAGAPGVAASGPG